MKQSMLSRIVYWLPRILSIAFVLFISLFALDVFGEYSGWDLVVALLMHLLPSLVLLVVMLIAWKYDWVGALVFAGFALWYVIIVGFDRPWSWYAGISGPALLVGVLYFLSWLQKRKR